MPLTYADVLQPTGELEPQLFPHLTLAALQARITTYLAEGLAKAVAKAVPAADQDEASLAWTYHRCYLGVWQRLIATPQQAENTGQGSRRYGPEQAAAFLDLANKWLEKFEELVPPDADDTAPAQPTTASFRPKYVF